MNRKILCQGLSCVCMGIEHVFKVEPDPDFDDKSRYDGAFQATMSAIGTLDDIPLHPLDVSPQLASNVTSAGQSINVTLVMLSRKSAKLIWSPEGAFFGRDFEIVFTPEDSNYKVVISLSDPVENFVHLHDLRPYTHYHLIVRSRNAITGAAQLHVSLNFSTSVMSPNEIVIPPPLEFSRVQADEVFIVILVLIVWAGAVYVFFNQWGKIRGIIPYQPAFRKYDVDQVDVDDVASLIPPGCHQCETRQFHVCHRAKTFDGIMATNPEYWLHRRNNSTLGINCDIYYNDPNGFGLIGAGDLNLRKTKSAESVLCHPYPRIIVNESFDHMAMERQGTERDDPQSEGSDESDEEQGALLNSDPEMDPEKHMLSKRKRSHTRTESQKSQKEPRHLLEPPTTLKYRPSSPISGESTQPNSPGCLSPSAQTHRRSMIDIVSPFMQHQQQRSPHSTVLEHSKRAFLQSIRSSSVAATSPPAVILSNYGTSVDSCPLSPTMMKGSGFLTEGPVSTNPNPSMAYYPPPSPRIMSRAFPQNIRRQTSLVENTIPLTTTLVNRMCKKNQPRVSNNSSWGGSAQPTSISSQTARRQDQDYYRRKHFHYSSESGESVKSAVFHPTVSSYYAQSRKQRMGSFRSRRLQKQHPIHLSDSEQPEQFLITPSQSPPTVVASTSGQTGPTIPTSTSDGSWFPRRTSAEVSIGTGGMMMMMVKDNFEGIEAKQSRGLEHLESSSSSVGPSGIKSPSIAEAEGERSLENPSHFAIESTPSSLVNPDSIRTAFSASLRVSGTANEDHSCRSKDQQRWSVSSDTEATKASQIFWRYGSGPNSKSSRDSKDAEAGYLDKITPTNEESQGAEKSIFLSVPYRIISEENN
ncbi:uncharacterized protein LOC131881701 isoform X2 [Tigriopus californicus]|uniref:uncharacterized protein LOC131881701 isoform X2 n=1 Tax=Tigriopus californicus TaxID=6832 RepID=UPI0027DA3B1C|nr:uncharacterized protein LOC131881701 isoform X2 [Tigriopus californicus]